MNVLFVWPPERVFTGSLFKHFTYFGETIGYLNHTNSYNISVIDAGVKQYSYSEFYKEAVTSDVIIIYVETYTIQSSIDIIDFFRATNPDVKIIVYGTACCYIPLYFASNNQIDVIIFNSNWEKAIENYLMYLQGKKAKVDLTDIYIKIEGKLIKCPIGETLPAESWGFPAIELLPIDNYFQVRGKKQIELTVNKGCGFNCAFCSEKMVYGHKDYRRSVNSIISFIKNVNIKYDTIYFDATTFTFDRDWVDHLCDSLIKENLKIKWRTVTRIDSVDEELIKKMSEAGCYKISFGIETIETDIQNNINKHINIKKIEECFSTAKRNNIIPRALIIIGLPEESRDGFLKTYNFLREIGCEIRVKEYIPYNEILNDQMVNNEIINRFDRSRYYYNGIKDMDSKEYMKFIFDGDDK